jgi:hypothetical protein
MLKLKIVVIFLLAALTQQAIAQKIVMYKTFGGVVYMLNDSIELSTRQTGSLLFSHEKAYAEFKKAKHWSHVSAITGATGAALVAVPLVTLAFGEQGGYGLMAGGGALVAFGMVSNWIYKGRAFGAIELYNEDLPQKSSRIKPEFQFYGTGARLTIRF